MPEYKDSFITDLLCRNNLLETELRNARYTIQQLSAELARERDNQWVAEVNHRRKLEAENAELRKDNLRLVNDLEAEGIEITQTRRALFNFKALLNEIREIVRVTSLSSGSADYRGGIAKLATLLHRIGV